MSMVGKPFLDLSRLNLHLKNDKKEIVALIIKSLTIRKLIWYVKYERGAGIS